MKLLLQAMFDKIQSTRKMAKCVHFKRARTEIDILLFSD